jgi:hypothetical protein
LVAAMRDRPGSEAEIGFHLAAARREEEISGERPEDWQPYNSASVQKPKKALRAKAKA